MSPNWDDLLAALTLLWKGARSTPPEPRSKGKFVEMLLGALDQVENPLQLGQLLQLVRAGRPTVNTAVTTRSNWEAGRNFPTDTTLDKYLEDLGVPFRTWRAWRAAASRVRPLAREQLAYRKKSTGSVSKDQEAGELLDDGQHAPVGGPSLAGPNSTALPGTGDASVKLQPWAAVVLQRMRKHRWFVPTLALLVAVAVGAVVAVFNVRDRPVALKPSASGRPSPPTASGEAVPAESAVFTYPTTGAAVTSPLTLRGRGAVSDGRNLWILLRAEEGDPRYFVTTDSPVAVDGDGNWSSNLRLGRGPKDEGFSYHLCAITSPVGGIIDGKILVRPKGQYSVRLAEIPSDSTLVAEIQIKLAKY